MKTTERKLEQITNMTGADVRRIRNDLGMTQAEFGKLLGFSPTRLAKSVSRLELRDQVSPQVALLVTYVKRHGALNRGPVRYVQANA